MLFYLLLIFLVSQLLVNAYYKFNILIDTHIVPAIRKKIDEVSSKYSTDIHVKDEDVITTLTKTHVIRVPSTNIEKWIMSKDTFVQMNTISIFSLISLIIMKAFVVFNSVPELFAGSFVGFGFYELFKLKYKRLMELKELYSSLPIFTILPILLLVLRNFFDTYRIGLVVFNMSSMMLFLTTTFSTLFSQLLHITHVVYPHKSKIFFGWCVLGLITMLL